METEQMKHLYVNENTNINMHTNIVLYVSPLSNPHKCTQ